MVESSKLVSELNKLKKMFNLGHELQVVWLPGQVKRSMKRRLSGEILGNPPIIYIYDELEAEALATLEHEFLEYALTEELISPYKCMINGLISIVEEQAYRRRERLVKRLYDIVFEGDARDTNR